MQSTLTKKGHQDHNMIVDIVKEERERGGHMTNPNNRTLLITLVKFAHKHIVDNGLTLRKMDEIINKEIS